MAALTIELDALDENIRGNLRLWKAPYWRFIFFGLSFLLTAVALFYGLSFSGTPFIQVLKAATILFSVPFLLWFFLSNRYSTLFTTVGAVHIISGKGKAFTYELSGSQITQESESGKKHYALNSLVNVEKKPGYNLIIFKGNVIYLPARVAATLEGKHFVDSVEQHITSHSRRGARKAGTP